MTKQLSTHAAAAKMIRQELKKNGIKGRVRSSTYAGGSSIRVALKDALPAVKRAVEEYANQFQYGHFDGMIDMYEYSNSRDDIPQVKFVFTENSFSPELKQEAYEYIKEHYAGMEDAPEKLEDADKFYNENFQEYAPSIVWRVLGSDEKGGFWASKKERVAA